MIAPPPELAIAKNGTTTDPAVALLAIKSLIEYAVVSDGRVRTDVGLVIAPE
jgi:hypothetical protein